MPGVRTGKTRLYYKTKKMMERNLAVWPVQMDAQAFVAESAVMGHAAQETYKRLKTSEPGDSWLRLQYWLDLQRAYEGKFVI